MFLEAEGGIRPYEEVASFRSMRRCLLVGLTERPFYPVVIIQHGSGEMSVDLGYVFVAHESSQDVESSAVREEPTC